MPAHNLRLATVVRHRIDGLEKKGYGEMKQSDVRHRIDGLEIAGSSFLAYAKVRHRIDGLEK